MRLPAPVVVRATEPRDFEGIVRLSARVYPGSIAWSPAQLASHCEVFHEGQFVAERDGEVVGASASLIVFWDDYDIDTSWRDFTEAGMFTNHDPAKGRTLYGAEVMVEPKLQGQGIGKLLYAARRALVERLGLLRIRAGARLRDYHKYATTMSAPQYVGRVMSGELQDRTLSFQLRRGFRVIGVVGGYLRHDPESLGFAAIIEWLNAVVAEREGYRAPVWRAPA